MSSRTKSTPGRGTRMPAWTLLAIILLTALLAADGAVLAADPARVVIDAPAKTRTIALTFDDGWQPGRCGEIFETLERFDVPATWFPNAVYMGAAPGLWRRIAERHAIGNHTTHHLSLPGRPAREVRKEIRSAERRIEKLTGRPMSKLLRPPYGALGQRLRREAGRLGYDAIVLWDVSANDTSPRATERGVARAALRGKPGSIVLMHCGPEVTPLVLPVVIARYACDGFRFATVEGLLAGEPGVEAKVTCPPPKLPQRPVSARTEETDVGPYGGSFGAEAVGGEWQLTHITDGEALGPVPDDVVFTLRFEPGKVSGFVGCDVYTARSSSRPDGVLELSRLMRSFDGCEASADDPASPLDLLMSTASQRIVDDALELLDADGRTILRFATGEPSGLLGDWIVSAVADDSGAVQAAEVDQPITATFASNGSLSGSTGCSSYRGGYSTFSTFSTFGSAVSAGPLLAAAAACEDDPAGSAAHFLQALRSVAGWSLRDGVLELRDARDSVVLELLPNTPGT